MAKRQRSAPSSRFLPALYSDNYLTVLPGEPRVIEIRYPVNLGTRATVKVRGWNVQETSVRVSGASSAAYLPYAYPQPWQQPVTTPAPTLTSATVTVPKQ
jgi:Exo-beta-D-glucosaminidase Ig-fold domain